MIYKHILLIEFFKSVNSFFDTQLNGFKYFDKTARF